MGKIGKKSVKIIAITSALAVAAPAALMPAPSYAGSRDGIIGFGAGVLIGIGIGKSSRKARGGRYKNRRYNRGPRISRAASVGARDRNEVRQIQSALASLGYYRKNIDGDGGPGTKSAIASFQADRGFASTGKLSASQKATLFSTTGTGIVNYQNQPYANPYGQNYAGRQSDGEVSVFGNSAPRPLVPRQPSSETTVFGNQAPAQPTPTSPPAPAKQQNPSPEVDSNELATIFDNQQPPDDSKEVVDSGN